MPPKFKPKQPKARKKKTAKERAEIVSRQKKEDAREDQVTLAQKRQAELYKDPLKFLTGMNPGLRGAIEATYRGQKKYYEEQPDGSVGPTLAPGSPPLSPRAETPQFPPGIRIKGKNLGKAERAHNRALKGVEEPEVNTISQAKHNIQFSTLSSDYMYVPSDSSDSPFTPNLPPDQGNYDEGYVGGDYVEAILGLTPGTDEDPAPSQPNPYLDIMRTQPAIQPDANVYVEEGASEVVKLTKEEKEALLVEHKGLKKQMKMAKTQEEKDYYKRAMDDLIEGDTKSRRSRRQRQMDEQIASAPVAFTPQKPGIAKYPGPANIQDGFKIASTEVDVRPLDEQEEQEYMGKGTTGQTERYSSDVYADTFYVPPEPLPEQTAKELSQRLKRVPVEPGFNYSNQLTDEQTDERMGINEDLLPTKITEDDFVRDYEIVDYSASQRRKAEAKGKSYPTAPNVKKILQGDYFSMINQSKKVVDEPTEYDYTRKSGAPNNPVPFKKSMDPIIRGGISFTATGAPEIQYSGVKPEVSVGTTGFGGQFSKIIPTGVGGPGTPLDFSLGRKSQTKSVSYQSGDKVRNPDKTKVGGKRVKDVFQYNTGASNQQIRYYGIKR